VNVLLCVFRETAIISDFPLMYLIWVVLCVAFVHITKLIMGKKVLPPPWETYSVDLN